MRCPLSGPLSQLARLLRRSHSGFERHDHLDPALALQRGERGAVETTALFEQQIARASHRGSLQQGTTQRHIVSLDRGHGHLAQQTGAVKQGPSRGQRVPACRRPLLGFDHATPRIRPGVSRHLDASGIEEMHPSAPPQAGVL